MAVSLLDARADETSPFADASRLVAIGGSVTEIVYALGEEARLVGRDSTSVYPETATELPDIGYIRALSPEGVLSIGPSAILALEGSGPPETIAVLRKAEVPFIMVPERFDREGIVEKIRVTGAALGVVKKAEKLALEVDADIKQAETLAKQAGEKKRVLFILSMQGGRILASGTGSAANGIIEMAGAANAMGAFEGYKQVSEEAVIEAQPDIVLMMDRGGDHAIADAELFTHPAIASTPAGHNKALVRMDGAYLLGFGPRTASAIRDLSAAIYGPAAAVQ